MFNISEHLVIFSSLESNFSCADRGLVLKPVLTVQEVKGTAVGVIGRDELRNQGLHVVCLCIGSLVESGQLGKEIRLIEENGPGDIDEPVWCPLQALLRHQTLFEELFPGAKARDLDLDIDARLKTGQSDQIDGQIVNPNGFTHIEDEDLPVLRIDRSLQNERNCLRNGHEIADDVLMRDRHGAARFDLLLEQRNDGTIRSQHIAKAHGDEFCVLALTADGLHDHLTQTLGGTHDVGRIDGFIRGDLHKDIRAILVRTTGNVQSAEHVILNGFIGACLHERNVLVCRRIEHDLRPVLCKDVLHFAAVTNAADEDKQIEARYIAQQFLLNIVCVVLVDIEDDELFGFMGRDLTAELAPDGAASARHQHHTPLNGLQDLPQIDFHLLAAEKIGDLHGAHLFDHRLARDKLIDTGQDLDLAARGDADLMDPVDLRLERGWHGDEDLLDPVLVDNARDVLRAADDFHAFELCM